MEKGAAPAQSGPQGWDDIGAPLCCRVIHGAVSLFCYAAAAAEDPASAAAFAAASVGAASATSECSPHTSSGERGSSPTPSSGRSSGYRSSSGYVRGPGLVGHDGKKVRLKRSA